MNFGLNLWNKAFCRMHGLVVIEGMTLSGHPWIINEIRIQIIWYVHNKNRNQWVSTINIFWIYLQKKNYICTCQKIKVKWMLWNKSCREEEIKSFDDIRSLDFMDGCLT